MKLGKFYLRENISKSGSCYFRRENIINWLNLVTFILEDEILNLANYTTAEKTKSNLATFTSKEKT